MKLAVAAPLRRTTPCVAPVTVYTSSAGVLSGSLAVRSAVVTTTAPPFATVIASSPPSTGASLTCGLTVAVTVAPCGAAVPSVRDTVKLPSSSLPSWLNETRLASRSACVKLAAAAPLFSTLPCDVPVTV